MLLDEEKNIRHFKNTKIKKGIHLESKPKRKAHNLKFPSIKMYTTINVIA